MSSISLADRSARAYSQAPWKRQIPSCYDLVNFCVGQCITIDMLKTSPAEIIPILIGRLLTTNGIDKGLRDHLISTDREKGDPALESVAFRAPGAIAGKLLRIWLPNKMNPV